MKMIYGVKDRPKAGRLVLFSLQQLLAILAATIAVPMIVGNGMSPAAALFGAGIGTIVYLLFTNFKSPVFLGSSFAFLGSMSVAFTDVSTSLGYLGLITGAAFAGLVYVIIAIIVKFAGVKWIDKIMPAVVIGPTVAIIGLSLAGNAVKDLVSSGFGYASFDAIAGAWVMDLNAILCLICGIVTLGTTVACSVYGKKMIKMIPFIIGILAGYILAAIFTGFSYIGGAEAMRIIDFSKFASMQWYPDFAFVSAIGEFKISESIGSMGAYIGTIAVAYIPVAFVVFAEHLADHKNISSIIETDLLTDPGLSRTLLGDGIGSVAGAVFGGCPNTTYGESVGCVAISGNASVVTIVVTACMAVLCAFLAPFTTFLASIPKCVMGGVCIALYGFIAVSGLKMIQKVDLGDNKNLFVVSIILIAGVGGMALKFGPVKMTEVACALVLGIVANLLVNLKGKKGKEEEQLVMEGIGDTVLAETAQNAPVPEEKEAEKEEN